MRVAAHGKRMLARFRLRMRQVFGIYGNNTAGAIDCGRLRRNSVNCRTHDNDVEVLAHGRCTACTFRGAGIEGFSVVFCDY